MFHIKQMNRNEAMTYLQWQYPEPYDFYNTPATGLLECLVEIMDPASGEDFYAVYKDDLYYGIFSYKKNHHGLELGIGIRPEECGKHQGPIFTALAVSFARNQLQYKGKIWLRVADFNQRGVRAYEKTGFTEVDQQLAMSWDCLVNFIHMELTDEMKVKSLVSIDQYLVVSNEV